MLNSIKKSIAEFIIKRYYVKSTVNVRSFKNFVKNSIDYLCLLPQNDADFADSLNVIRYLILHKKNVTVLLPEHKYNLLQVKDSIQTITYKIDDVNKLGLPSKRMRNFLTQKSFDCVVDLNRSDSHFLVAVSFSVDSDFRIGFTKKGSDNYYNFQVANNEINAEISYKNLLNSLSMF